MRSDRDSSQGVWINPLPIIMVVLLAAGVLVKNIPLESARPSDAERVKYVPIGQQNVEARLWQDPFAAVEKHEEHFVQAASQQSAALAGQIGALKPEVLLDKIGKEHEKSSEVKVLAISVFGGSFAEAAESRRRSRFAVISALGFHGYSPENADTIGYFRLEQESAKSEAGETEIEEQIKQIMIPFEWFERTEPSASKVLLLWLNESLYVPSLVQEKLPSLFGEITLVGPAGSAMLMKLLQHADAIVPDQQNSIRIFSPSATISDCKLPYLPTNTDNPLQPWQCFFDRDNHREVLEKKGIVRTIGTDDVLAVTLLWELWQRGVNREQNWPSSGGQGARQRNAFCKDGVVLISEWDSAYARTLSHNLVESFSELCSAHVGLTPPVHRFNYLRGLDGVLASVDKPVAEAVPKNDSHQPVDLRSQLEAVPTEHAEGLSQYDYLRRLTSEIDRLDRDSQFAQNGIKAIGVIGMDVYDKLLILQALRPHFKGKIFFTTDLDARYLHADQKDWARNLVVASNFGLAVHPALQQSTLPFRDGYQTSTYLAALMALSDEPLDYWAGQMKQWLRPQVFEIGRSEAVLMASPAVDDLIAWISGSNAEGISHLAYAASCDDWARCEQITVPVEPSWTLPLSQQLMLLLAFALLALWMILSSRVQHGVFMLLPGCRSSRYSPTLTHATTFWLILLGVIMISVFIFIQPLLQHTLTQGTGEPLIWLEGVSVWPNLVIRFLGFITMLGLILVFVNRLGRQAQTITERFNLAMPSSWSLTRSRFSAMWIGPYLDLTAFDQQGKPKAEFSSGEIEVSTLWQNYLRATRWRQMIGWIVLSTILVFLLSMLVFSVFGIPSFPHRGELVKSLHYILIMMTASVLWLTIFWIGYESRACIQLIEALGHGRRQWPEQLLEREENETGLSRPYLDHYLDFQLIVAATQRIHWLIYLPFVSILFTVIARSDLFDIMDFPLALILLVIVALLYTLHAARLLNKSAGAMRTSVVAHYEQVLLRLVHPRVQAHPPISAEQINRLIERVRNTREGAFVPFTQQPALQALLLPFGGFGGAQLLDYLFRF